MPPIVLYIEEEPIWRQPWFPSSEPLAQPMSFTAEVAPSIAPYVPVYTPEALRDYHDMAVVNPNDSMEDQLKAVYTAKIRKEKIASGKMPKMLMPEYDVNGFRDDEIAMERQNQLKQAKMDSTLLAAKAGVKAVKMGDILPLLPLTRDGMLPSHPVMEFVANYEQFRSMPYRGVDAHNLTIGFGHVIRADDPRRERWLAHGITYEEALDVKRDDMERYTNFVRNFLIQNSIQLNQHQFDALVSYTFNFGPNWMNNPDGNVRGGLLTEDFDRVRQGFMASVYVVNPHTGERYRSQGLINRRMDEWEIFAYGDYNRNH